MTGKLRIRPAYLKDALNRRIFSWSGPAASGEEAKALTLRHAGIAWQAITAVTGRQGEMPKGKPMLGFMRGNSTVTMTSWKAGRAMHEALAALPQGEASPYHGHDYEAVTLALLATDPTIKMPTSQGDYGWLSAFLDGKGKAVEREIAASYGHNAAGTLAPLHQDTIEAMLAIFTAGAATGRHPSANVMLKHEGSATLTATKIAEIRQAAPRGIAQAASLLAAFGLSELSVRILARTE